MAMLYCDSFDHYSSNTDFVRKGWTTGGDAVTTANGRNSTRALEYGAFNRDIRRSLGLNTDVVIAGVAFRTETLYPANTLKIISFMDGASEQIEVRLQNNHFLGVYRAGTLLSGDGPTEIILATWYYIEFKVTIGNAGSYEVRVNGAQELVDASEDTQNTANAFANIVRLGGIGSGTQAATWRMDDFYVCDDSGGVNDDFLGDIRVEATFPDGNGNTSNFDGSDGNSTDNYLLVDETTTPDDDTTYVESPDVGDKDTYTFGNLVTSAGTVLAVQPVLLARKTDAGSRRMASVARHSATEVDSADHVLGDSYLYHTDVRETKPGGGTWSISDVNGAEFGQKVTL